jgi:hypothetical protein
MKFILCIYTQYCIYLNKEIFYLINFKKIKLFNNQKNSNKNIIKEILIHILIINNECH